MSTAHIIFVVFFAVLLFVVVQGGEYDFDDNGEAERTENRGGSQYGETQGNYGGSGRFNGPSGFSNTGFGNGVENNKGQVTIRGMDIPEKVIQQSEKGIHSLVEKEVETIMTKGGVGDETKKQMFANKAADMAVNFAEAELRNKPKSKEYKNQEGWSGSEFNSPSKSHSNYDSQYKTQSYDDHMTADNDNANGNSEYNTGYGGHRYGYGGYESSNSDQTYGESMAKPHGVEYGDSRSGQGGVRIDYGGENSRYPQNEDGQREYYTGDRNPREDGELGYYTGDRNPRDERRW